MGVKNVKLEMTELSGKIQSKGYKMTKQRRKVLESLINNCNEHMTAEEIYKVIKKDDKDIGFATVYRSLDMLEKSGVIQHLTFGEGCKRYHFSANGFMEKHYHLVCEECGKIIDINQDVIEILKKDILGEKNFIIRDQKVQIYGICQECSNKHSNKEDKRE